MASIGSILVFIALLSILIIAHEMGHFWVARCCGMKVERFGFGLPLGPTLWSKTINGVEYCIHAFLVGGYVAFPDDNPDSPVPVDSPERFENQPVLNRFLVAIAGITVNLILGWGIMTAILMIWGTANPTPDVTVGALVSHSAPAYAAGFQEEDIITAINHTPIPGTDPEARVQATSKLIKAHPGEPIVVTILRHAHDGDTGKTIDINVTPGKDGLIGVQIMPGVGSYTPVTNPVEASSRATAFLSNFVVENFKALGGIITGQVKSDELAGPIRIIQKGGQAIEKHGMQQGFMFMAIISTILAVMNILPIPGLDGGHILFILIEAIKGSPLNKKVQDTITQVGFAGLMVLMVLILGNDFINIFHDTFGQLKGH